MGQLRAVGYVRVSQEDKDRVDTSLETQEEYILDFCKRYNCLHLKTFNEGFISGAKIDRPELNRILELANDKAFDILVIKNIERLARDQQFLLQIINQFRALRIQIYTIGGDELTKNPMITGILGAVAQQQIDKGREEQRKMMDRKKRDGKPFGSVPFGYKVKRIIVEQNGREKVITKWVVDENESEIVKKVFELYALDDYHTAHLVGYKVGISPSKVVGILRNKKYIGIFDYIKREKLDNKIIKYKGSFKLKGWKSFIDEELFYKVQAKIDRRCHVDKRNRDKMPEDNLDQYNTSKLST